MIIVITLCHTSPTYSVGLITISGEINYQSQLRTDSLCSHTPVPPLRWWSCYRDGTYMNTLRVAIGEAGTFVLNVSTADTRVLTVGGKTGDFMCICLL